MKGIRRHIAPKKRVHPTASRSVSLEVMRQRRHMFGRRSLAGPPAGENAGSAIPYAHQPAHKIAAPWDHHRTPRRSCFDALHPAV